MAAQLLVLVLDREEVTADVMDAWRSAGAPGITLLDSTGPGRLSSMLRDDLPLMPSLKDLLATDEAHHRTLFTVLPDEEAVQRVVAATIKVVGDFSQRHTGVLFTVPVGQVWGLNKVGNRPK
ncbi:MAG: P-II family nitrogen regulator [Anaerolineae bacterium]